MIAILGFMRFSDAKYVGTIRDLFLFSQRCALWLSVFSVCHPQLGMRTEIEKQLLCLFFPAEVNMHIASEHSPSTWPHELPKKLSLHIIKLPFLRIHMLFCQERVSVLEFAQELRGNKICVSQPPSAYLSEILESNVGSNKVS
jgi:hypothetical protein